MSVLTNFDGIPFRIMRDGRSVTYTDWRIAPAFQKEHVPYSNITITERMGHAPAVVTWRLRFDRREEYYAFLAKLGSVGTLTVLAGFQSLKGEKSRSATRPACTSCSITSRSRRFVTRHSLSTAALSAT